MRAEDTYLPRAVFAQPSLGYPANLPHVMEVSGDKIAQAVLDQFDKLPAKRKPLVRGGGVREWVPLSGIVAQGESFWEGWREAELIPTSSRKRQS